MSNQQQKPPIQRMGHRKLRSGVSMLHERLVGRLVIAWGFLEAAMQDCIWHILNVPLEDGRVITARADANTKLQWLRSLSKRHLKDTELLALTKILDVISDAQDDRNFIVHGVWEL